MSQIDPTQVMPAAPVAPSKLVGVVSLHAPKTQLHKQHTNREVWRVLEKLQPAELLLFGDVVGVMAANWASREPVPYSFILPSQALYLPIPTQFDDDPPSEDPNSPRLWDTAMSVQTVTSQGPTVEAYAACRRWVIEHSNEVVITHNGTRRHLPYLARARLKCERTVVIRPDGGETQLHKMSVTPDKED